MNNPIKSTIGQAIDQTTSALASLDKREQQIVISTICSLLGLSPSALRMGSESSSVQATVPRTVSADLASTDKVSNAGDSKRPQTESNDDHGIDIRTLKSQKQPASAQQMACLVAYYLQEHAPKEERTKEVTTADLERLFKQAGYKLPVRMEQVLVNAKIAGYFESVDRGKYRLTRVGYNLITHSLPRATAA